MKKVNIIILKPITSITFLNKKITIFWVLSNLNKIIIIPNMIINQFTQGNQVCIWLQQPQYHYQLSKSEQSTPKFKNSEVKFRKKSHKNSFGGDLQVIQYKDLLQNHYQKMANINNAKVFSQYFDMNEVQSCAEHVQDHTFLKKKNSFQQIIQSQHKNDKNEMKGSTTINPTQNFNSDRRKDRKISSSQIISYSDFNFMNKKDEKKKQTKKQSLQQKEHDDRVNAYNSLVVLKDEPMTTTTKMRNSIMQQRQLQRIQQFQSSQRQSTHPDQMSQPSDVQAEVSQNQIQVKLKDRKYSYFTQQMASTKTKKAKEIESSNYVFKIPKNLHKNQELIHSSTQNNYIRHRHHNSSLRLSQMQQSQQSAHQNANTRKNLKESSRKQQNLKLSSGVIYSLIKFQPSHWVKKQTIYYFNNGTTQKHVFQRSYGNKMVPINSQENAFVRESFGSSNTLLSNIKQGTQFNISPYSANSIRRKNSVNPYEINQTSFLKNRMNTSSSVTFIQPSIYHRTEENDKSIQLTTCRSLKNIHSNSFLQDNQPKRPKVNFNYISSNQINRNMPMNMGTTSSATSTSVHRLNLSPTLPSSSNRIYFGSPTFQYNQQTNMKRSSFYPFTK